MPASGRSGEEQAHFISEISRSGLGGGFIWAFLTSSAITNHNALSHLTQNAVRMMLVEVIVASSFFTLAFWRHSR